MPGAITDQSVSPPTVGMQGQHITWTGPRSQLYLLDHNRGSYSPDTQHYLNMRDATLYPYDNLHTFRRLDSGLEPFSLSLAAVSLLYSLITFGMSIAIFSGVYLATALLSTALAIAATATGLASSILRKSDPHTAGILEWISLGCGIASVLTNLISARLLPAVLAKRSHPPVWQETSPGSNVYRHGDMWADCSGTYAIELAGLHGAPFNSSLGHRIVSGQKMGKLITQLLQQSSSPLNRIRLQSCYSGNGGMASQAQVIANMTGRPTTGYFGKVALRDTPRSSFPFELIPGTPSKIFQPLETGTGIALSRAMNMAGSGIVRVGVYLKHPQMAAQAMVSTFRFSG